MSSNIVHLEPDPHAAVQMLLPWYLTGRLAPEEFGEVEEHLAGCALCRAELETERLWRQMQPSQAAQVDVEEGWARMRARIGAADPAAEPGSLSDVHGASAPAASRYPARGWRGWRAAGGRRAAAAPAMPGAGPSRAWGVPALLSVALVAAITWTLRPATPAAVEYHALATPAADSATAVVRFRPDATEAQIRASLNASGARLVDGPTVTDAYVVRLPRERYEAGLATLRRQQAVALVEALGPASPP